MSDGGFDTALQGTPEEEWRFLQTTPWTPQAGPLVVLGPHPDDETLGAGGLIYTWVQRRLPVTVISVTDGEAACPEIRELEAIRRAELLCALRMLSCDGAIRLLSLGIPDGHVCEHEEKLAKVLKSVITDDTTLIAPFELDGHPDHDAVGRVARVLAQSYNVGLAQYPIWAWHQATPELLSSRELGSFSLSDDAQVAKRRATSCHASQLRDRPGGAIVPPHVRRYFQRPYEVFLL